MKANKAKCDGETNCFCKGEHCLAGGGCHYGDVFINGKPIANSNWDIDDGHVICRQMGFWKAKDYMNTYDSYRQP